MPHKRAKNTIRQQEREKRGTDLAPSGSTSVAQETVPKSLTRVLHAETVRKSYNEKRGRGGDVGDEERATKRRKKDAGEGRKKIEIKHGESLAHFNRRVEDDMRAPVAEAMHASRNHAKRVKKSEAKVEVVARDKKAPNDPAPVEQPLSKPDRVRKTEFDTGPSRKRLNDIVQAPPTFTKLPRGAARANSTSGKAGLASRKTDGIVSMAQKQLMEGERAKAIMRYRELKGNRLAGGLV